MTFVVVPFAARGLDALKSKALGIALFAENEQLPCIVSHSDTLKTNELNADNLCADTTYNE